MINTLITLVIYIIVIGLILWLLQYIVNTLPMFEPFRQIANIVIMVIGVLFLIAVLLSVVGGGGVSLPRLGGLRPIFA
jgi:phosphoglycerol transferase MdoB-like AlkP superfamily enzyme